MTWRADVDENRSFFYFTSGVEAEVEKEATAIADEAEVQVEIEIETAIAAIVTVAEVEARAESVDDEAAVAVAALSDGRHEVAPRVDGLVIWCEGNRVRTTVVWAQIQVLDRSNQRTKTRPVLVRVDAVAVGDQLRNRLQKTPAMAMSCRLTRMHERFRTKIFDIE